MNEESLITSDVLAALFDAGVSPSSVFLARDPGSSECLLLAGFDRTRGKRDVYSEVASRLSDIDQANLIQDVYLIPLSDPGMLEVRSLTRSLPTYPVVVGGRELEIVDRVSPARALESEVGAALENLPDRTTEVQSTWAIGRPDFAFRVRDRLVIVECKAVSGSLGESAILQLAGYVHLASRRDEGPVVGVLVTSSRLRESARSIVENSPDIAVIFWNKPDAARRLRHLVITGDIYEGHDVSEDAF